MIKKLFLSICFVIVAASCSQTALESTDYVLWCSPNGSYSCEIPKTWEFQSDHEGKIPGFYLLKKVKSSDPTSVVLAEPASMISVKYYRLGNNYFSSPDEFIRHIRQVSTGTPPQARRVGSLLAQTFEISFQEAFPPNSTKARWYDTKTRYVVIPQGDEFWSLEYTAISGKFSQYLPVFEQLVDSFRPQGKW